MNKLVEKYMHDVHFVREKEYIMGLISGCESPIEELFVTAFYSNNSKEELEANLRYFTSEEVFVITNTQVEIGKYRTDFFIKLKWPDATSLYVVELDGHDFHEKTKEQVKRRNERDRFFASKNITTIHFSGSEIFRDVDECISNVIQCIEDNELSKRRKV